MILARAIAPPTCRNQAADPLRRILPHLYRRLRHTGNLPPVLLHMRQIAADKYLRMPRRIEKAVDEHAPAPVRLWPKQLAL